jgi:hypothetical protein
MSALGHKQTFAPQNATSALPPIATAKADTRNPSCLLYPQKRTCAAQQVMSALGQKRTLGLPIRLRRQHAQAAKMATSARAPLPF